MSRLASQRDAIESRAMPNRIELPPRAKDLKDLTFGSWTVIQYAGRCPTGTLWLCRCECGFEKTVRACNLTSGDSTCCRRCYHNYDENGKREWLKRKLLESISKVDSGCWEWQRGKSNGYGYVKIPGQQNVGAHILSYRLFVGGIPDGQWVLHRCDNPPCINPDHLFLGTCQDNIDDMRSKGRNYRPIGELNKFAKLTWAKVAEIRKAYRTGAANQKILAERYGVAASMISCVVNYVTWTDITVDELKEPS